MIEYLNMKNSKVDDYIDKASNWQKEIQELRNILLDFDLTEELKWKAPCYTFKGNNIVLIGKFKDYVTLSFFKGVLLSDNKNILVSPGENSQTVKMIKFTKLEDIFKLEKVLKEYIFEAIEIERHGLKVEFKKNSDLDLIEELENKINENNDFKKAFLSLTPGRQRGYNIFFSSAKQSKTRKVRIEKNIHRILNGFGLNDCTCGLTKRKPGCDGSHKTKLT